MTAGAADELLGTNSELLDKDYYAAVEDYDKAILFGIVKIASKMGISTIQSYQGSKIFEAIGIAPEVTDRYFTGTVSRIGGITLEDIARVVHEANPQTLIHVDAVQAFGKIRIYPKKLGIDMLSVSGHKFHAPKGTGFLWVRSGVKVHPLMLGGGQQKDRRSGTDNVPGWAAMAMAAEMEYTDFDEKIDRLYELRDYFIDQVSQIDGTQINGGLKRGSFSLQEDPQAVSAPHIVSVSFADIRAEVLLHALEERGIYVSSGSACSSNHPAISGTLRAIGTGKAYLDATIRFSFSFETTKEEIDTCIAALKELVPMLRRYTPGGRRKGGRRV